jgi:aryl-alcohol dehydrogenase-like predicted oxidoreductase
VSDRRLGRTTAPVPAIGQGTFGLGGTFARDPSCDAESVRALRLGIDLGLRLIDTAPVYGAGHAEELVGQAVRGVRESVLVATKFSPADSTRAGVVRSAEASLRRLGTDRIDLLQVHWPHAVVPLDETLEAMAALVRAGKVRFLGLGNCTAATVRRALASDAAPSLVSVQQEYGLGERSVEARLLPLCRERGLTLLAYSPLAQGALAPADDRRALLAAVARRHQASVAQVVLAWLARDPAVVAIPKAASPEHVRANAAAADLRLAADDCARVSAAFAVRTETVPVEQIVVEPVAGRAVYTTLDEARENRFGLVPGPLDLAAELAGGEMVKPIKVQALAPGPGGPRFRLTEGRVRYWGWVIAHKDKPIPAIVEGLRAAPGAAASRAEAS